MPLEALLLTLLAAFLHAFYNFFIKSSRDTIAYFWWTVTLGGLGYGAWLLTGPGIFLTPASTPFFLISTLAELGYFIAVVRGYAHGDLSLGERLSGLGYLGIAIVVAGIYLASLTANGARGNWHWRDLYNSFRTPATRWALAAGFFISVYSLTDKLVLNNGTPPLVYNFWVYFGNTILWTMVVWYPRARIQPNLQVARLEIPRIFIGGLAIVAAYLLVLTALAMTSASYVVAARSASVIIGALFGTIALKERFGPARVVGAALMVVGIALMAIA